MESWDGKRKGPGQLDLPHSLDYEGQQMLYIAEPRRCAHSRVRRRRQLHPRIRSIPPRHAGCSSTATSASYIAHRPPRPDHETRYRRRGRRGDRGRRTGQDDKTNTAKRHSLTVVARDNPIVADTLNYDACKDMSGDSRSRRQRWEYLGRIAPAGRRKTQPDGAIRGRRLLPEPGYVGSM